MVDTRQIGRLTIHFLGENAAQLRNSFDGSFSGSQSFRSAMSETARTHKNIYVGGSLEDLQDQPGFDSAGFHPDSREVWNTNAFGKQAGSETYFIVVSKKKHSLIQDGQKFAGSTDLSLVHELLHPSQIIRELSETGSVGKYSEARTQMREQTIAQELGKIPGQDFPDVIGSGVPYTVQLESPEAQPQSAPRGDPALPVDPTKYERLTPPNPTPVSPQWQPGIISRVKYDDSPDFRILSSCVAGSGEGNSVENRGSSPEGVTPQDPTQQAPPPRFSGATGMPDSAKPIRYLSRRDGITSPASVFDTDASFPAGDAGGSSSMPGHQGPAPSTLLEYIQRLNQLSANKPQASIVDPGAPGASLTPSDVPTPMGGLAARIAALAGIDPDSPDQPVPQPGGLLALLLAAQR